MGAQAKIINMLLYDGNLNGVIRIEDSNWNAGELFSAPRESVDQLIKTGACNKYGVYLLISFDKVYVGQSSDLAKRISQHITGKDWWESVIILTTKDDSLNHSDIDYLENVLIEKAFDIQKLDCDNKKSGNPPKVDIFKKTLLNQYLEEAFFLMQLIGIRIFVPTKKIHGDKSTRKKKETASLDLAGVVEISHKSNDLSNASSTVPPLPDNTLKAGQFVKKAIDNLAQSGYVFSDEMMEKLCAETSMKSVIGMQRNLPFFKKVDRNDPQGYLIGGYSRYYHVQYVFGKHTVYLCSQIYECDKEPFAKWYLSLSAKTDI